MTTSPKNNSPELQQILDSIQPLLVRRDLDTLTLLVNVIVGSIVDEPDKVEIAEMRGERTVVFEIKVADQDHKFLLGSDNGQNIRAARKLLIASAVKLGVKVEMSDVPRVDANRGHYRNAQEKQRAQSDNKAAK